MRCLGRYLLMLVLPAIAGVPPTEAAAAEAHFLRYPDVSRAQIVFSYGGSLWTVSKAGGAAVRLTFHAGEDINAKFSPDGRWIAFTSDFEGNPDVYVIPASGGDPRRLTFHPSADNVLGWTHDGKRILFQSNRFNPYGSYVTQLFTVPLEGGPAAQLPIARGALGSYSPDGTKLAITPTPLTRSWKRYRGGATSRIQILDPVSHTHLDVPRSRANDTSPMWHDRSLYFASDRDGVMNLYRCGLDGTGIEKLTSHTDFDVKWPSEGPEDIVYENGGRLFLYNFRTRLAKPVTISLSTERPTARAEIRNVANQIRSATLSPSGNRILISARGEILTIPRQHGPVRNLTQSTGVHERSPAWSPDGKWIAYLSDRTGEYELYMRPQNGGHEIRLTTDGNCYRFGLDWSPDSSKIAFTDKKLRLWYLDVKRRGAPVLVDTARYSPGITGRAAWSPDSRWLAYVKLDDCGKQTMYLYSLERDEKHRISTGLYDDFDPQFDPSGTYLYFLSRRLFKPTLGQFEQRFSYQNTTGVFVALLRETESPFAVRTDEELPATGGGDRHAPEGRNPTPAITDVAGIPSRVVQAPIAAGDYQSLAMANGRLFFLVAKSGAERKTLVSFDLKKRELQNLLDGIDSYSLDRAAATVLYRAGDVLRVVETAPGRARVGDGRVNTANLEVLVDPSEEWPQLLREAWRIERDFFWDPAMGGVDWDGVWRKYSPLLPWVAQRSDLNYLMADMVAELGTSHTYVSGGDIPPRKHVTVGLLGADFVPEADFFKITKIYRDDFWDPNTGSPLAEPGLRVQEGQYVVGVNGVPVRSNRDLYSYFQNLAGKVTLLCINSRPSLDGAWEVLVKPMASESALRYRDWVDRNRREVDQASGNRVAYVPIPNTSANGVAMFDRYLMRQLGKQALIIDARYNTGGMIPDFLIEKLQRPFLNILSTREGQDYAWPRMAIHGPKVLLVNELSGSGGDALAWYFRQLRLGPVVGKRTWGGLIGTSRTIPMIDGGNVSAPELAFWSPQGGAHWIVENHGVDPDFEVEQEPGPDEPGSDAQLERAIQLAVSASKAQSVSTPRPAYPVKAVSR